MPDELRRYALTLNVAANADFNSVQVIGTSNYCFDGTGNDKLINLDWTANHPYKIFKTSPQRNLQETAAESETLQMELAPNPAMDFITVEYSTSAAREINLLIFDMPGKTIAHTTKKLLEGKSVQTIDISNFTPGCYFIKAIAADDNEQIGKFVKR